MPMNTEGGRYAAAHVNPIDEVFFGGTAIVPSGRKSNKPPWNTCDRGRCAMKRFFFSFALAMALAIPALASDPVSLMSNCKKGEGKCETEFYNVNGKVTVTLNCTDGGKVHHGDVSSPNAAIACATPGGGSSQQQWECDFKDQKITYDIKSHLTCK